MAKEYFLGIDLGGTNIKALLFDSEMAPVRRAVADTRCDSFVAQVRDIVTHLRKGLPKGSLLAVGVGFPGIVDTCSGIVRDAENLRLDSEVPLRELLESDLSVPVFIEHDVKLFALAEMTQGAGKNYRNYIGATIGTGIGIAVVIDGRILDSPTGNWGHIAIDYKGARCICGGRGCLENIASGSAIARDARERAAKDRTLLTALLAGKLEHISAKDVFEAARRGDSMCLDIVARATEALAAGISNLVALLNPEVIIVGGGVAQSADVLFPLLHKFTAQRGSLFKHPADLVIAGQLGQDAGCIGAGLLARQRMAVNRGR